jgi:hypothetical protein
MSGYKCVILALLRIREAADTFELSQCMECLPPSRQYLMPVSLVAYVPQDTVVRRIEYPVQSYGKLYRSQTGGQMSGVIRQHVYDVLA